MKNSAIKLNRESKSQTLKALVELIKGNVSLFLLTFTFCKFIFINGFCLYLFPF